MVLRAFRYIQGYGSSFSYTFNNDTWKKWKEKLSGTRDSDKKKEEESASDEEGAETDTDGNGIPKKESGKGGR